MSKRAPQKASATKIGADYQRILARGIEVYEEIKRLRQRSGEIHRLFPELREKLSSIQRGEINPLNLEPEEGCDYNPLWSLDDLSPNEKDASAELKRLSTEISKSSRVLDSIRTELQPLLLRVVADRFPLDRDTDKESLLGFTAPRAQAQAGQMTEASGAGVTPVVAAASGRPSRRRRQEHQCLSKRQKVIRLALRKHLKGMGYCTFLHSHDAKPREDWIRDGCPDSYPKAYHEPKWQERIHGEKYRERLKMESERR